MSQPAPVGGLHAVGVGEVHGVHRLAVDVELELAGGAVADAHRPRPAPALEMIQGLLGQIGTAVDAVHDLQRVAAVAVPFVGAVPQPAAEGGGLLGEAEPEQRVDGERAVPDPGVPVVPVALAAGLLGQPGGGRGHDRAGRRVGHQLERDRRARHHLPPPAGVGRTVQPVSPEADGLVGQALDLFRWQPPGLAAHHLQHDAAGLACPQRPGRPQPVTAALHRDPLIGQRGTRHADRVQRQLHAVRLEHGAVLGQLQLVRLAGVVEPRLEVHHEPHSAAHHPQLPHQPVPVRRRPCFDGHEIADLTDPVRGHEPGDQDGRVREVQLLADIIVPVRPDPEVAAVVRIEQGRAHAGRVEAGTAEPVHGAVRGHQRGRLQIADQPVIADVGVAGHHALLPAVRRRDRGKTA